jgi:hypothetical protein
METVSVGGRQYRIRTSDQGGVWTGCVERADTGDRFGLECSGSSAAEVTGRLTGWLTWQHEHMTALAALQSAERAYHRAIAAAAFDGATDPTTSVLQRQSLAELEAATEQLNRTRAAGRRYGEAP